ncbi:MAG: PilN domain-containing protein [Chitinispirillia bacterium]|nr:PilN domain-containing protein [Chitinispirillia bacterium]
MKTTDNNNAKPKYKKTMTGVIHTPDGSIICVKIKMKHGRWVAESADSWSVSNVLKTALTLSEGAVLGLNTEWRRTAPNHSSHSLELPISAANADFNPYLHPARSSIILEALSGNITSVVTEDSFLLTLPLAFCKEPQASFVSIFYENDIVTFGIVIERKLEAVFSFPCKNASYIEASSARIKRYWRYILKRDDFPKKVFIFHDDDNRINDYDGLDQQPLALPEELLYDGGAMKAAGAALTALYPAPAFKVSRQHGFKIYRPILLKTAVTLLCISLLAASVPVTANLHAKKKLTHNENIYNIKLNENQFLKDLEKAANEFSSKILSIKKTYDQSSRWGSFLQLLAEVKPDSLFLERLGSDQIQGAENKIRIALNGWAHSENSVTEFISSLQASDYINSASLVSMERDAKNKNICKFRILCVVQLAKE